MTIAYFPSTTSHDVIELDLLDASDQFLPVKLLVDSGFTGTSGLALSDSLQSVKRAPAPAVKVVGALSGTQSRVLVTARISRLGFERTLIAVIADMKALHLPDDVSGIVGLRFLRCFRRWGAEHSNGLWEFFLEYTA